MTIVKYGIDWEVTGIERSINFVTIGIQSDGLHLVGYPNIDLFDGPYLAIKHVVMANNTYSIQQCFRFYAKELTPLYYKIDELTEELTWYTKLHNGYTFPKTLFKPYNDMYIMYNPIGADSRAAYYNVLPNCCDNCSTCDLRIEIPLLIVLTDNGGNSYSLVQSMRGT